MKDSKGDENVENRKEKLFDTNDSVRFKILQQNIKRESNNLINLDERKDFLIKNQIFNVNNEIKTNDILQLSYRENKNKNFNSSNIFENISEISKRDDNYIDRGVKTSIFDSDLNNRNSQSKSIINPHEPMKGMINYNFDKQDINNYNNNIIPYQRLNRLEINDFDAVKHKKRKNEEIEIQIENNNLNGK